MSDLACANCTKRFETGNPASPLQCRALPPAAGPMFAIFPHVKPTDFCHVYFEADAAAVKANREAAAQRAQLDERVAETRARAEVHTVEGVAAAPAAEVPEPKPAKRARRARSDDAPKLDL